MTNPSAPSAVVKPFGPTEAISILVTLGGLLAALFGRDWGISRHAEQIVSAGYLVGPVVFGFSRALKHHAATGAAAMVYVADAAARSAAPVVPVPVSQNVTVVQPPMPPADTPPEPPADAYPGTPPAAAAPEVPPSPAEPAPTGGSVQVTAPAPAQPEPPAADTPAATAIPVAPLPAQPTPTAPYAGSPADTGPAFAT